VSSKEFQVLATTEENSIEASIKGLKYTG